MSENEVPANVHSNIFISSSLLIVCYSFEQATIEHRRLAVDLAEVIVKWEVQRIKDDPEFTSEVRIHRGGGGNALFVSGWLPLRGNSFPTLSAL